MDPVPTKPPAARKEMQATDAAARRLVLVYAVVAGLWILLSDAALGWLFDDSARFVLAGTIKGWLFVGVTSLLLYVLLRRLVGQVQDVSRSEHGAQAEKLQALQLLDAIAESSTDAIFAKDIDDRFLVFNRAAAQLTGKRPEEVLGRDEMVLFPPELARQLIADNRRVMAENRVISFEEKLVTPEGLRTYLTTKGPMHDAAGKVIGMFGIARDITDLKRAEAALRESEIGYRSLFENMMNGYAHCRMLFDNGEPRDFIYLDVNKAFEVQTGLQNVVGRKVSEVIPGIREADPDLFDIYGRVALSGQPESFETYVEALGMWFSISVYSPQREHFVAVFDVITERKLAEQALRESEAQYRSLFENNMDGILLTTPAGGILAANAEAQRLLGYTEGELCQIGREGVVDATDSRLALALVELEKTSRFRGELTLVGRDGIKFPVELSSLVFKDKSGRAMTSMIFRDVTERKQAAAALENEALRRRLLMEGSRDGIAVINQRYQVVEANPRFAEMLGYTPEEMLDLHIWDWDATMTEAKIRANFVDPLNAGVTFETRHRRKNGTLYDAEVSVGGAMVGEEPVAFTVCRDITERKSAEEALHQQTEEVRHRNEELERFNRVAVGRELEMIGLKRQVNALSRQLGQEPPYALSFLDDPAATPKAGEAP